MPHRGAYRKSCRGCKREREEDEVFSVRGKCEICGHMHAVDNLIQLKAHAGPWFQNWREGMARSVGAVFPDE